MIRRLMLVCSCILCLTAIAQCRVFADELFPVLARYSIPEPKFNDERFEELARAGFNHRLMRYSPEANQKALNLAHNHGIKKDRPSCRSISNLVQSPPLCF